MTTLTLDEAFRMGSRLQAERRFAEAETVFRSLVMARQDEAAFHNGLALALRGQGRAAEAMEALRRAVTLKPTPAGLSNLANLLCETGDNHEAAALFRRALELDPSDPQGAALCLAAMGLGALPDRAPDAQLARLYAMRTQAWDTDPHYRGAALAAGALRERLAAPATILDAGCGTGRGAPLLRPLARRLDGVDLSAEMLALAADKGSYDNLHHADLVGFLAERADRYDAISCAAVLVHFGDLAEPLRALATALRSGGILALTFFPNEADPEAVAAGGLSGGAQGGIFVHGRDYICRTAAEVGLAVEQISDEIHEVVGGKPVIGLLVVLAKDRTP